MENTMAKQVTFLINLHLVRKAFRAAEVRHLLGDDLNLDEWVACETKSHYLNYLNFMSRWLDDDFTGFTRGARKFMKSIRTPVL